MSDTTLTWADIGLGDMDIAEVEEAEDFEDKVKDGVFQAVTQGLKLGKDEKSGIVYAVLTFEIANGELVGETFDDMFWNLGDPEAFSRRILKSRMKQLGLPDDFRGMPDPEVFKNIPVVVTRVARKGKGANADRTFYNVTDVKVYGKGDPVKEEANEPPAQQAGLSGFFN